jgi:hypothetical protein
MNFPRNRSREFRPRHAINRISKKKREGTPGGAYIFDYAGKHYELPGRFIQDETAASDDKRRWVATLESGRIIRRLVCQLANKFCELSTEPHCWKWAPLERGQPHHLRHKKMGNAFGDDRIWIVVDGELVRVRIWACPTCHQNHHNRLHWTRKDDAA